VDSQTDFLDHFGQVVTRLMPGAKLLRQVHGK
jgi:hypothetical protein